MKYEIFSNLIEDATETGSQENQYCGRCPFHKDARPSFSFNTATGQWICHAGCGAGNYKQFCEKYHETFPREAEYFEIVKTYTYEDWSGNQLLRVSRQVNILNEKKFLLENWAGYNWRWGGIKDRSKLAPYRYHSWSGSDSLTPIFLVEGEKCVEAIEYVGGNATTTPMGATNWNACYSKAFENRTVYLLPDNDDAGRKYSEAVLNDILPIAKKAKIVVLPDLGLNEDVADWLVGRGLSDLIHLCERAPESPAWTTWQRGVPEETQWGDSEFLFQSIGDVYQEPDEPPKYIVDGLLVEGTVSIVPGDPKVGKSTFARQLAVAVAEGTEFLGRKTLQGPVLYIAVEELKGHLKEHFKLLGAGANLPIHVHCGRTPLDPIQKLEKIISQINPKLVVVDPLILMIRTEDSNSYDQTYRSMQDYIELARKTQCHICMIHHANKGFGRGMERTMGSQAYFASASTAILLLSQNGKRTFSVISRHAAPLERMEFSIDPKNRSIILGESVDATNISDFEREIIEVVLESDSPLTRDGLIEKVGGKSENFSKAFNNIKSKIKNGEIKGIGIGGSGKKGKPWTLEKRHSDSDSNCNRKEWELNKISNSNSIPIYMEREIESEFPEDYDPYEAEFPEDFDPLDDETSAIDEAI